MKNIHDLEPLADKEPDMPASAKHNQSHRPNQAEIDIDNAVERVYEMYGPDLSVFFEAVQNQLELERHERRERCGYASS